MGNKLCTQILVSPYTLWVKEFTDVRLKCIWRTEKTVRGYRNEHNWFRSRQWPPASAMWLAKRQPVREVIGLRQIHARKGNSRNTLHTTFLDYRSVSINNLLMACIKWYMVICLVKMVLILELEQKNISGFVFTGFEFFRLLCFRFGSDIVTTRWQTVSQKKSKFRVHNRKTQLPARRFGQKC